MSYEIRVAILNILQDHVFMTYVIRNKLQYDHKINLKTYQVRSTLRQLEKEGLVKLVASAYKVQLRWKIVKH